MKQNVDVSFQNSDELMVSYIHAVIVEKCMTFKDIFPGLSRSWNFQEKIQDFPGGVGTL